LYLGVKHGFHLSGCDCIVWTDVQAAPALFDSDAFYFHPVQLGLKRQGFRAVAPRAAQRAAFEKQRKAYARTVVYGKALNVEYLSGKLFALHFFLRFLYYIWLAVALCAVYVHFITEAE
jgi:hypothetical protein